MSCLNHFNIYWFRKKIKNFKYIFFLDDHNLSGGMSDLLIAFLNENQLLKNKVSKKFGFKDFPACGTYDEVLNYHKLNGIHLSQQIIRTINND